MNMPGFCAEGSLYNTRGHYMARRTFGAAVSGGGVVPQLPIGFCMAECDDQFEPGSLDNTVCKFGCMGGDGGGGDGRELFPGPARSG